MCTPAGSGGRSASSNWQSSRTVASANVAEIFHERDVALRSLTDHIDTGTVAGRMRYAVLDALAQFDRGRAAGAYYHRHPGYKAPSRTHWPAGALSPNYDHLRLSA
jgi:hypothetical protein